MVNIFFHDDEEVSDCCGASYATPGWPDNDLCSECKEHSEPIQYHYEEFYDMDPIDITRKQDKVGRCELCNRNPCTCITNITGRINNAKI